MDDNTLSLYTKGMATREILAMFKEIYDVDVSSILISKVANAVLGKVIEWQYHLLDTVSLS